MRLIQVLPGECHVSTTADDWLGTILGSCIAVCLRDRRAGIGAMNHYLLARGSGPGAQNDRRYGEAAMAGLISALAQTGSPTSQLEAKIFGGARVMSGIHDIGAANAHFALHYLAQMGVPVTGHSIGGTTARRIQFHPASGRVRQLSLPSEPVGQVT